MKARDIVRRCSGIEVYEERCVNDDYCEVVFFNKDLDRWNKVLIEMLGPPVKPTGEKPKKEDIEAANPYGGIYQNQTLFRKETERDSIVAMYWPWQDDTHTTLKIAVKER